MGRVDGDLSTQHLRNWGSIISSIIRNVRPSLCESLESRTLLSSNTTEIATPTPWQWYHGVSQATLSANLSSQHQRLVDIQVVSGSPLTLNATAVANTGAYAATEYWAVGQTAAQVSSWLSTNHARLLSLDPYVVSGKVYFAPIAAPNTGASAKTTYWYASDTSTTLNTHVGTSNRLIDAEPYTLNGVTYFADVLIKNTGADFRTWRWTHGATPTTIASLLASSKTRLTELKSEGNGLFTAIMQKADATQIWWYTGQSAAGLSALAAQDDARIFDLSSTTQNGSTTYSAVMINNGNALETTVGNILRAANKTAVTGAYIKPVGGAALVAINSTLQYEPASGIKPLVAVVALAAVQNGTASLTDPITYYYDPANPTNLTPNPDAYAHTPDNAVTITLQDCIGGMLQNSDNRMTDALELQFGLQEINAMAAQLGMKSTVWTQTVGNLQPGNYETLTDADLLYEKVLNGTVLNPQMSQLFQDLMLNQTNFGLSRYLPIIHQEAAKILNVALGSAAEVNLTNSFASDMIWGSKAGTYFLPINADSFTAIRTHTGYLGLPIKVGGVIEHVDYTYGVFVNNAVVAGIAPMKMGDPSPAGLTQIENAITAATQELARPVIHSALLAFK